MASSSRFSLILLAAGLYACGADDSGSPPSTTGTGIQVSNETSGDPVEQDGYSVTVDAEAPRALDVNGSIVFSGLPPGDHTVALSGVEPDCGVLGANPRIVPTTDGTAESVFLVRCSVAGTGRILVQTYTYGGEGGHYHIATDDGRTADLGPKDEYVFAALPVGPVTLTLTGADEGCQVTAPNPRTLEVREHEQILSIFKIHCDI